VWLPKGKRFSAINGTNLGRFTTNRKFDGFMIKLKGALQRNHFWQEEKPPDSLGDYDKPGDTMETIQPGM